ncbi:lysophospholipid acyltransferase family protein [Aureimonas populi]|uniref:Lysophospholipid acyltransferase family protein n=1 Tax=Aureimonas populi TaxID=1701758 RepID=A0ABW5CPP7_9HYPH|nr:lysophospholipid acyltransferase family protein [Aureimonas populi]
MIAKLRAGLALALLLILTVPLAGLQALAICARWPLAHRLPRLWHRLACRVIGLRVIRKGAPAAGRPLLLVSNHQSWADIVALGSAAELCFIAKSDVRDWPLFGLLARLQRTIFVEREARGKTGRQASEIAARLAAGDAMVLFAEGTTSDGNGVLPFRTALFGAAQGALRDSGAAEVLVQPVSVAFTRAHGMPLGRFGRPLAAWPGEVKLVPHLLTFVKEGAVDVELRFGEPVSFTATGDRKALARGCERQVRRMLAASLSGVADEAVLRPAADGSI